MRRGQRLPDVGESLIGERHFVEQGDETQRTIGVGCEVAKLRVSTDPDAAVLVHRQGTHDARTGVDLSPGDSVVLQDLATGIAEVHYAAAILQDGPDLRIVVVGARRVVLDHRHAGFVIYGRCCRGRRGECWGRHGEGEQRQQRVSAIHHKRSNQAVVHFLRKRAEILGHSEGNPCYHAQVAGMPMTLSGCR